MILLADSGSTKTNWSSIYKNEIIRFNTIGFNPYFTSEEKIIKELQDNFPEKLIAENITEIFFYGSGCGCKEQKSKIQESLQKFFTKATILVESDLVGAAIACFGNKSGLVSILGTGMNIGYWNGQKLITPKPSLGFILGDEGSGAVIGKIFVKSVLEQRFSENLCNRFFETYNLTIADILTKVYKEPNPNTFLAGLVPFIAENQNNEDVIKMVAESFTDFIHKYVLPISREYQTQKIAFVGSVSVVFKNILCEELTKQNIQCEKFLQAPINELESYFLALK